MIRVLHIIDKLSVDGSNIHGPARQLSYRIPCYDPQRLEARICNLRGDDAAANLLRGKGIEVTSLGRSKFDPRTIFDLRGLVRNWKPDLLHVHGYASWNFGRIASRFCHIPIVCQEHFVDEKVPWYQQIADRILRGSREYGLAVSESVRQFMVEQRFYSSAVEIIWNGVPQSGVTGQLDKKEEELRAELGFGPDAVIVGIVGRLAEMKGHCYFLEGAALASKGRDDLRFLIVGEGPLRGDLESLAESLGIREKVVFAGYRPDAVHCLRTCEVAVVSSIFGEGFCIVGVEAHLAHTPLVITDLPAFEGLYVDGVNARVVPLRSGEAISAAIIELLDSKELSQSLIDGGLRRLEECRVERIAEKYLDCYRRILAG